MNGASSFGPDKCGNPGAAYLLNGQNAYASLGTSILLKPTDVITVSTWILTSTLSPTYQNIISDHAPNETTVGFAYILRFATSELQFITGGVYGEGTGTYAQTDMPDSIGAWKYVVAIYDETSIRLYIDAALKATVPFTQPMRQNQNPMLVGASGFGEYFNGSVDDTRLYHRALDASTISCLYAFGPCSSIAGGD